MLVINNLIQFQYLIFHQLNLLFLTSSVFYYLESIKKVEANKLTIIILYNHTIFEFFTESCNTDLGDFDAYGVDIPFYYYFF